jgi:hypothetical protein
MMRRQISIVLVGVSVLAALVPATAKEEDPNS